MTTTNYEGDEQQRQQQQIMDQIYSQAADNSSNISCLYRNFQAAVTILRMARNELDVTLEENVGDLDSFYDKLKIIEERSIIRHTLNKNSATDDKVSRHLFIAVVEGLDGSGKSTLVRSLADKLSQEQQQLSIHGISVATPPASLKSIRSVFDKRGGPVARAFYMVSNYVLDYEMEQYCIEMKNRHQRQHQQQDQVVVFVVDRYYTSTCAYTVAYKNTSGGCKSIDELDDSLFSFPLDLRRPDLVLLLKVDDNVRKERVASRGLEDNHNPWDDRLNNDVQLGRRIFRAFERTAQRLNNNDTKDSNVLSYLDANQSSEDVLQQAIAIVRERVRRRFQPWEFYRHQPLQFFRWMSATVEGFCDLTTGRRCHHRQWAIQLALNSTGNANGDTYCGAPSMRSVGVHTVDESGILFFTRSHPGGGLGGDERGSAAAVCVFGAYPYEQQWRAEGVLCNITPSQCIFMDAKPPASLVGQILACEVQEKKVIKPESPQLGRYEITPEHIQLAKRFRPTTNDDKEGNLGGSVCGWRFVPLRMEWLQGGPSSPGGPRRLEWTRTLSLEHNGWSDARSILPFSPPSAVRTPLVLKSPLPITLVLTGAHCSGKTTIGKELAEVFAFEFQGELGDILRENITPDGHRTGYTTSSNKEAEWDDKIYREELQRDRMTETSRIVETWHTGNYSWAKMRGRNEEEVLVTRTIGAIREQLDKALVLFVHLRVTQQSILRRRMNDPKNQARIPLTDEEAGCSELHLALDLDMGTFLNNVIKEEVGAPVIVLENSGDGNLSVKETTRKIVQFVNENLWRTRMRRGG